MKRFALATALSLAATAASAQAPQPPAFVPPTIDEATYNSMMTFLHSTPMSFDTSNALINTLLQLELRAQQQAQAAAAAQKAAATPPAPAAAPEPKSP